jgi:hypothetical protein
MGPASAALLAPAAVASWIDCHPITRFHGLYIWTGLNDFAGYLVPESHRLPDAKISHPSVMKVVKV